MRDTYIYKILRLAEWDVFSADGIFSGSPVDHKDGYIHLSTQSQLQDTLDKHYTDNTDIIITEVTAGDIADDLRYEVSRGGDEFPHLYASLNMDVVHRHWRLTPNSAGRYDAAQIFA